MGWNRFHLLLGVVYLACLALATYLAGRKRQSENQYLNATGSMPLWVCILASVAANCGSLDVTAMMALGAQYGMVVCHFYWIGAVPALLLLIFWLLPAYAQRRYISVLDFIARAYGRPTRTAVALCVAIMMLLLAGVCLSAAAQVMQTFLGWDFTRSILVMGALVLAFTWVGGLRATVYVELLHFAVVLIAVAPLVFLVVRGFGGFSHFYASIPADRAHLWQTLPVFAPAAAMDRLGLIFGLGVVLSFGYWSTDFVLVQRALAVRRASDVPFVPLTQAVAKILFAFLIVLPGVAAPLVLGAGKTAWNATLPAMMLHYYSPAWAALSCAGLLACLISTYANNISGFSAAWVEGIDRPLMRAEGGQSQSLWAGRLTNAAAVLLSMGAAWLAVHYQSLMEYIQLIFSIFNAPLLALVLLAALVPKRAARGGLAGLLLGMVCAAAHQILAHLGWLRFGSQINANFYSSMLGFTVAAAGALVAGAWRGAEPIGSAEPMQPIALTFPKRRRAATLLAALGIAAACIALNVIFR